MKNLQEVIAAVVALQSSVSAVEATQIEDGVEIENIQKQLGSIKVRDRGPKSTKTMSRFDAWQVMHGDLKDASHKAAAQALGLSYGQVYSARGDYTFKDVKPDSFQSPTKVEAAPAVVEPQVENQAAQG